MHLITAPCGMRCVSWSRMRRAAAGRTRSGRRAWAAAPRSRAWRSARRRRRRRPPRRRRRAAIRRTGALSTSASPSCSASAQRHALRAADEAVLLRAALGVEQQVVEAARGVRCRRGRAGARCRRARPPTRPRSPSSISVARRRACTTLRRIQVSKVCAVELARAWAPPTARRAAPASPAGRA